jgi:hypothetical protein
MQRVGTTTSIIFGYLKWIKEAISGLFLEDGFTQNPEIDCVQTTPKLCLEDA